MTVSIVESTTPDHCLANHIGMALHLQPSIVALGLAKHAVMAVALDHALVQCHYIHHGSNEGCVLV